MQERVHGKPAGSRPPAAQHRDDASLAAVMADVVAGARSAWPAIHLATDRFAGYLVERLPGDVELEAAIRRVHASDLYLACACLDGNEPALAAFERHCLAVVDRALPRLGVDADAVNEVKQRLRRALLIPGAGPPQIAKFSGRGDLRSWIRVLAVREALTMARHARRHVATDEDRLVELVATGASPEIEYLKRRYRREFETSFRAAIQTLSDRDRTLVRQHFLDSLSVQRIARLHRVHRVTAGRWLEGACATLLTATRTHMAARLDLSPAELESIHLVLSKLEISLRPLFRRSGA